MTTRVVSVSAFFGLLASILIGAGCGQRVCVAGIGACAIESKPGSPTTAPLSGDAQFALSAAKTELFENETLEIKIQNSNENWEIRVVEGPNPLKLEKSDPYAVTFTANSIAGTNQFTKLRGKDLTRYKSDTATPLAFAEIVIQTKKKVKQ